MNHDFVNLIHALKNNVKSIHFSSKLDPIIIPKRTINYLKYASTFQNYTRAFIRADPLKSEYPEIVEYYKLKFTLKPFSEIVKDYESLLKMNEPGDMSVEFNYEFLYQINEHISNREERDLYLIPLCCGMRAESNGLPERAVDFYEEAYKVAANYGNETGVDSAKTRMECIRRKLG